jgi:hypothetical protein
VDKKYSKIVPLMPFAAHLSIFGPTRPADERTKLSNYRSNNYRYIKNPGTPAILDTSHIPGTKELSEVAYDRESLDNFFGDSRLSRF